MEPRLLSDPEQYPSEKIIFSHIGKSKPLWVSLFDHLQTEHPDITPEWRYYNDGKSWLMKATTKKKTIFWLSIVEGSFRTTFYFNARLEPEVMASGIADEFKAQYQQGLKSGKLTGLTLLFRDEQDVHNAKALIALKKRLN
ncbi:MAG TPA: DUF3788 family protein [bacterium]|nr:DUF3788 family protein [bacterium]HQI49298.1 DUF3788 family protein [bacterium]HQJ65125.1 DUF3788 family protein [bacterium]